jgi:hypothetical protein
MVVKGIIVGLDLREDAQSFDDGEEERQLLLSWCCVAGFAGPREGVFYRHLNKLFEVVSTDYKTKVGLTGARASREGTEDLLCPPEVECTTLALS